MSTSNEHNNAPAVPQGEIDKAKLAVKALADEAQANGSSEKWVSEQERQILAVIAATPAPAPAVPRVEVCCLKFDTCRNQCVPLVDHLRGQIKELKAAPAVPQGMRIVPIWLLERVERSLGAFTSDEGWAQTDMDTMDSVSALIAATPAPAPAQEADLVARGMKWDEADALIRECASQAGIAWSDPKPLAVNLMHRIANKAHQDGFRLALSRVAAPAQEVGLTDDQADAVSMALRRAWQLGQTYWQQADSDYISQHKKSEETQRKFEKLCDDTIAALRAKGQS